MKIAGLPVVDGKKDIRINITAHDVTVGSTKNPAQCAAALACKRKFHSLEARVFLSRIYIKQKGQWLRYKTPEAIKHEIISFDRGGKFFPGKYMIKAPSGALRLGAKKPTGPKRKQGNKHISFRVITSGVREDARSFG